MKKTIELREEVNDTLTKIRKESLRYIKKMLKKYNGSIDFSELEDVCLPSVCYDGGRHPEYDTNAFSSVFSVFLNADNEVCLEIDDCDEYEISRINWDEVFEIGKFIYENF